MNALLNNLNPLDAKRKHGRPNPIKKLTLTGLDQKTNINTLVKLAEENPFLEFGFLYNATPNGRNRFPHKDWLALALPFLSGRSCLHICGYGARKQLLAGELTELTRHTPRVQVNGTLSTREAFTASRCVDTLITQHTHENATLLRLQARNHSILVNSSGGKDVFTDRDLLHTHKKIGIAVGSDDHDICAKRRAARPLSKPGAWIDLKDSLRVDDWFNEMAAKRAVSAFANGLDTIDLW
jgi:hypothetical protein